MKKLILLSVILIFACKKTEQSENYHCAILKVTTYTATGNVSQSTLHQHLNLKPTEVTQLVQDCTKTYTAIDKQNNNVSINQTCNCEKE
jgi:hypothetical protein